MPLDSDQPILADPVMKALHAGAEATWSELLAAADGVIEEHQQKSDSAVAEAKAIAEQAIEQRDNADTKNQELIKALQAKESDLASLSKSHNALGSEHRDLEKQLVVEQTKAKGLDDLVKELRGVIEQTKTEAANADRRSSLTEEQLSQARQAHAKAIVDLKQESEATRQQLELRAAKAQTHVDEQRMTLSSHATQIATLTAERDSERHANEAGARRLDETKGELVRQSQVSDKYKNEAAMLQERCASLQSTLAGEHEHRNEMIAAKDGRIAEQANMIGKLNDAFERALSSHPTNTE